MTNPESLREEALMIACFSIFLYGLLAFTSYQYYLKFVAIEQQSKENSNILYSSSIYSRNQSGRYDETKKSFFLFLTISALFDLPEYLICLYQNGPENCESETYDFLFGWYAHLIALCGYAYCIILPCMLWSDMIAGKDGKFFFSTSPDSFLKKFFQLVFFFYCGNVFAYIIGSFIYFLKDASTFMSKEYFTYCVMFESGLIVLLTGGCFISGMRLLQYVKNAKLPDSIEIRFLISLNMILAIMVLTFLGRAVLVIRSSDYMPSGFKHSIPYALYLVISRWFPDIFCQFCLILIMRFSGNEIIIKNSQMMKFNHTPSVSSFGFSQHWFQKGMNFISFGLLFQEETKEHTYSNASSDRLLDLQDHSLVPKSDFLNRIRTSISHSGQKYQKLGNVVGDATTTTAKERILSDGETNENEDEETTYFHSMIADTYSRMTSNSIDTVEEP